MDPQETEQEEKDLLSKLKDSPNFAPNPDKEERNFFERMKKCSRNEGIHKRPPALFTALVSVFYCLGAQTPDLKGYYQNRSVEPLH